MPTTKPSLGGRSSGPSPNQGSRRTRRRRQETEGLLDELDYDILALIQEDGGLSDAELARRVDLSPSGLKKRRQRLEREGLIERRVALLNRKALGIEFLCFVEVSLAHHEPDAYRQFLDRIQALPEVLECHFVTGQQDYLLKVVARDNQDLQRLLTTLTKCPAVDRVLTSVVLREIKHTTSLPLRRPGADSR